LIVFRQPTRKQEILRPVWGRCVFDADFGSHRGAAVIVDAIDLTKPLRWPNKLLLEDRAELERLIEDGHEVERGRRATILRPSENSVRNTILYRTLLHEIGHWQDWRKQVLEPARMSNGTDLEKLEKAYLARPLSEREKVAHRYAAMQRERFRAAGVIPFDPI
ncbi:MAG: ImmA/IrrE family metallo-endopeptidase, partial [Alphaproteobacteria bacterium]